MDLPTTYAEIDLGAIAYNVQQIKQKVAPAKVMAVVKANAYGHGVLQIVETALNSGADFIGVALAREGVELRKAGVKAPILVFGGFFAEQIEAVIEHDLCITLYDLQRAEVLSKTAKRADKKASVHIKVDTGMGRVGVDWQNAADFVDEVSK